MFKNLGYQERVSNTSIIIYEEYPPEFLKEILGVNAYGYGERNRMGHLEQIASVPG